MLTSVLMVQTAMIEPTLDGPRDREHAPRVRAVPRRAQSTSSAFSSTDDELRELAESPHRAGVLRARARVQLDRRGGATDDGRRDPRLPRAPAAGTRGGPDPVPTAIEGPSPRGRDRRRCGRGSARDEPRARPPSAWPRSDSVRTAFPRPVRQRSCSECSATACAGSLEAPEALDDEAGLRGLSRRLAARVPSRAGRRRAGGRRAGAGQSARPSLAEAATPARPAPARPSGRAPAAAARGPAPPGGVAARRREPLTGAPLLQAASRLLALGRRRDRRRRSGSPRRRHRRLDSALRPGRRRPRGACPRPDDGGGDRARAARLRRRDG